MDVTETKMVLAVLKGAYPSFYKGMGKEDGLAIVALWQEMFKDDSYMVVATAVKAHIAIDVNGYPPHIGAIKNAIHKITHTDGMSEMEAWQRVKRACSYYDAQQEFDRLPPILQRMVGSPNQLREWAVMDSDQLETVVGSNFMRSYKVKSACQKEYEMLPESVKSVAIGLTGKMDLNLLGSGESD